MPISRPPLDSCVSAEEDLLLNSQRKGSIVEADFQASSASPINASPEAAPSGLIGKFQVPDQDCQKKQESELFKNETPGGVQMKTTEESASPPPTPTRKAPFSRARLRLLSFRSMEESKVVASVKEKYPIVKNILDFVKDPTISHER